MIISTQSTCLYVCMFVSLFENRKSDLQAPHIILFLIVLREKVNSISFKSSCLSHESNLLTHIDKRESCMSNISSHHTCNGLIRNCGHVDVTVRSLRMIRRKITSEDKKHKTFSFKVSFLSKC